MADMDTDLAPRLIMFVCMAGSGVLLIWMARAAASGRLKRNPIAGIRTARTMESDEAWLAAHIRAKRPTLFGGIASLAVGVCALLPVSLPVFVSVALGGSVAMLIFVLYGAVVGGRAAAEATSGEKRDGRI